MALRGSVTFDEAIKASSGVLLGLSDARRQGAITEEQYDLAKDTVVAVVGRAFLEGEMTPEWIADMRGRIDRFLAENQ